MMSKKGRYNSPVQAILKGITDLYTKSPTSVTLPEPLDLREKTVMITGASSGLGFATAQRMAQAGASIIMAVRSGIPEKGEEVKRLGQNPNVSMYFVDLSDLESIKQLLKQLEDDGVRIDIFVSNAAMVPLKSRQTRQGLEEMFMVNYLSAFFLINGLIDREILRHSPNSPAKVIIVSSESHRNPEDFDWEGFGRYVPYSMGKTVERYGYFKLLLTTFANELSRVQRERKKAVEVRVLCPGPVNSNIAREAPAWMQPLLKATFSLFFKSPYKASEPILYFASQNGKNFIPIEYLFLMQPKKMDEKAVDEENGRKLWRLSLNLLEQLGYKGKDCE